MLIAVGSTNPVKVQAVEEVIKGYPDLAHAKIVSVSVPSEISEQPLSKEEMILGAKNRARNAFNACEGCAYGFGIEAGLFSAPGSQTGYLEASICCIYNGKNHLIGLSCGFEVPPLILDLVLNKKLDLSDACFQSGISLDADLGSKEGLIGLLTKGRVNRKEYTKQSIVTALIQLENSVLYQ